MTISKKVALYISVAFSISYITQAYEVNQFHYETNSIINFTQLLRQENNSQAHNVAQWLDTKVMNASITYAQDIVTLAKIINNPTLTTASKITIFSSQMQQETKKQRSDKISSVMHSIFCIAAGIGIMGFAVICAIEDAKNPRPIIYTMKKPSVTITYRTSPWPYVTYHNNWQYSDIW